MSSIAVRTRYGFGSRSGAVTPISLAQNMFGQRKDIVDRCATCLRILRGVVVAAQPQRVGPPWVLDERRVHTRTALVLGHVRGVILLSAAQAGLPVHAFPPATVKLQITGFGRAQKSQVALMVARLLALPGDGEAGDAADALAVALCRAHLPDPSPAVRGRSA